MEKRESEEERMSKAPIIPDCENCAAREGCPQRTSGCFCSSWHTDPENDPMRLARLPKPYEADEEPW